MSTILVGAAAAAAVPVRARQRASKIRGECIGGSCEGLAAWASVVPGVQERGHLRVAGGRATDRSGAVPKLLAGAARSEIAPYPHPGDAPLREGKAATALNSVEAGPNVGADVV
jgi:hypothetical protein